MWASSRGVVQGAIHAQHFLFDGQIVGLARTDEAKAGEAASRLLGHEAGLVIGGGVGHGNGSFPLHMVDLPVDSVASPVC